MWRLARWYLEHDRGNPEVRNYVLHEAQENDVKFFRLLFTEIPGTLKGVEMTVEELETPVESSHHEAAPSQHEINLRNSDALTMTHTVMTYLAVTKETAMKHGYYSTFMPKPRLQQLLAEQEDRVGDA